MTEKDVHHEEIEQVKAFLSNNGRTLMAVVLLASVVAGVTILYRGHTKAVQSEVSALFYSAQTADDLQAIADNYPSSPFSAMALLKLAKMYYDQRDYGVAINKYSDFMLRFPNHEFVTAAVLGEAHCLEEMNETSQALDAYSRFIEKNKDHFLAPQAFDGKARCLKSLGKTDEARIVYENFIVSHPESKWIQFMEERLDRIKQDLENKITAGDKGETSS